MKLDKFDINGWLQTGALIVTVILIGWQIKGDIDTRKVEATLNFVLNTAGDYRETDFKHSRYENGKLQPLTLKEAKGISCDKESSKEVRNMLAAFEWMATGVREKGLDFDTVVKMRGTYYTNFFERWRPYMQVRLAFRRSDVRRRRLYDQFEWLVGEIHKELNKESQRLDSEFEPVDFEGLNRKSPKESFKCPNANQ